MGRRHIKGPKFTTHVNDPRVIDYFWERVKEGTYDECWIWQGTFDTCGYGAIKLSVFPKVISAHRLSFIINHNNLALLDHDTQVCHSCDSPFCVNPFHLFKGNYKINTKDKMAKNRQYRPQGSSNPKAKLAAEDVLEIRKSKISNPELATIYGVSSSTIRSIKRGKTWGHVLDGVN